MKSEVDGVMTGATGSMMQKTRARLYCETEMHGPQSGAFANKYYPH